MGIHKPSYESAEQARGSVGEYSYRVWEIYLTVSHMTSLSVAFVKHNVSKVVS